MSDHEQEIRAMLQELAEIRAALRECREEGVKTLAILDRIISSESQSESSSPPSEMQKDDLSEEERT